jgi:hypothetical protein
MHSDAKRAAQEALFTAIRSSAENNMKAALRATEKVEILRQLAEAYRLTAGSPVDGTARSAKPSVGQVRTSASSAEGGNERKRAGGAERTPQRRPRNPEDGERAARRTERASKG